MIVLVSSVMITTFFLFCYLYYIILVSKCKHNLFGFVEYFVEYQLYYQLQEYCADIATSRKNTLIVMINPYYIKIDNLNHHNIITIPIELDNLTDVTFTKRFQMLPSSSQTKIKDLIQQTINKSKAQRKKDKERRINLGI